MVRLWDECPRENPTHEYFTSEELAENTNRPVNKQAQDWGVIVAWVDGVFYKAPEVNHG